MILQEPRILRPGRARNDCRLRNIIAEWLEHRWLEVERGTAKTCSVDTNLSGQTAQVDPGGAQVSVFVWKHR